MEEQRNPKMINNPVNKDEKEIYSRGNQNGPKLQQDAQTSNQGDPIKKNGTV